MGSACTTGNARATGIGVGTAAVSHSRSLALRTDGKRRACLGAYSVADRGRVGSGAEVCGVVCSVSSGVSSGASNSDGEDGV